MTFFLLLLCCRPQGQPFQAACCQLSVDDVAGAVTSLVLGHEPEQATLLALALQAHPDVCARALRALADRCDGAGDVELAAEALRRLPNRGEQAVELLAVRAATAAAAAAAGVGTAAGPGASKGGDGATDGAAAAAAAAGTRRAELHKRLGLKAPSHYAAAAVVPGASEGDAVRCVSA